MGRIFSILVAALAMLSASSAARAADWHRADTHHFVIYSDGDTRTLEEFATRAEMFDALFRQYFGLQVEADPQRLTIFLLADSDDVARLAGDEDGTLAGFYRATSEGSFAVANRQRGQRETSLTGQTVLFHEYVHHLMAHHFTFSYPAWYREGFAEYFATATFERDGDWTLGRAANHRAYGLRQVRMPLENVLFSSTANMTPAGVDAYYGMSWGLVHMFANDPQLTAQLNTYLNLLGTGAAPREAFTSTFGSVEAMDQQLDRYVRGRMNVLESVSPIAIVGDVRVTSLDDAASALAGLELERRVGRRLAETRDGLAALAAAHPGNADVLTQWALAERDLAEDSADGDYSAALAAATRALAANPDHVRANVLQAELLLDDDAMDIAAARDHLERAIASDPLDPLARITLYETYQREGRLPPVEVVNRLMAAFQRVPEDHNVRVTLAYALVNEGLVERAIALVEFLAADPHAGTFGRQVLDSLRDIQQRRGS